MYENCHGTIYEMLLLACLVSIPGCNGGETTLKARAADYVIPIDASVRDICFSKNGEWVLIVTRKTRGRQYEDSSFAFHLQSAKRVEISQDMQSVCRWGNGFLSNEGEQVFSFSVGTNGKSPSRVESTFPAIPRNLFSSGRMASNGSTLAIAAVWIQKGDGGQAYIPIQNVVIGNCAEATHLRTALQALAPHGIDVHCASITSDEKPTVAIRYPTKESWGIAVVRLDTNEPEWNTVVHSKLPRRHEVLGDEPYDLALRNDGQRIAVVGTESKQVVVLTLPDGQAVWSYECKSGGTQFETSVFFAGPQAIEYSQDGHFLFVATREGGLVFDAETGAKVAKLAVPVTAVACDLKGDLFAFATTKQVEIYSTRLLKR